MLATGMGIQLCLVSALLATTVAGCSEKKSVGRAGGVGSPKPGSDDTSDGTDDAAGGTFDLCNDGLEKASLSGFETYISGLCGDTPKLTELRTLSAIYTGGSEAKIFEDNIKKGATETSIRLYTSTVVEAKVADYWDLMQLQLMNR